jgi:transcriptional regulator of acetoin/glycerol metabolism
MAAWPLTLDQIIKQALIRSLRETGGNRRRTATQLGISRSTLYRMLARYGIDQIGRDSASR